MATSPAQFQALLSLNRHKLDQPLPRVQLPTNQARVYARALRRMNAQAHALALAELEPVIQEIDLARAGEPVGDGKKSPGLYPVSRGQVRDAKDKIGKALDDAEDRFWKKWPRDKMDATVRPTAHSVEKFQAEQGNKQLKSVVGVDVLGDEPWLDLVIDDFVSRNVALIKTVPSTYFNEIESLVKKRVTEGDRWDDIHETLTERFGVANSRAKLIARDQTTKFFGELTRQRHESIGITKERWRGMKDNRERESHIALEGVEYDIARPPLGGPGQPIQCRCYGEPVLSTDES